MVISVKVNLVIGQLILSLVENFKLFMTTWDVPWETESVFGNE